MELDFLFGMWFLTLISPFPVKKNSDVLCQIRWFSVFPAWKIFSHEAVRLLTFKVKCNKMGSGKFWAWHVATCTLCTSWNVGGILRTYEHLWRMVQTCCTWMRTRRVMARSAVPAAAFLPLREGSKHRAQSPFQTLPTARLSPGPAETTQELQRGPHWQLWEMICSKHAAAKKPTLSSASRARMLRTRQRASFCPCINLSVPCLAYCKIF